MPRPGGLALTLPSPLLTLLLGLCAAPPMLLQGSVLQCGLILGSSIVFWAFRSGDEGPGYGFIN